METKISCINCRIKVDHIILIRMNSEIVNVWCEEYSSHLNK